MRIIAGSLKGRRLWAPASIPARPTTDYARESLFNILNHEIDWSETDFLDLFAGIGGISLEAASRGARNVVAVDLSYHSVRWINQCAQQFGLAQLRAQKADALVWLKKNTAHFDLVFADPPYTFEQYPALIDSVLKSTLPTGNLFILEHRQSKSFAEHPNFAFDRTYGEVRFSFFRN